MRSEGPGSISGSDNLDSGLHPSGVGEMSSSQYVVGNHYRRLRDCEMPRVAYAAWGAKYNAARVCFPLVSVGILKVVDNYEGT